MEDAVLDTPVESGLEETTSVETPETPVETAQEPGIEKPAGKPLYTPAIQDGKLSPAIKEHLDKLKAENPEVEKQLRHALFTATEINKALPGGLKELNEMRALVENSGGREGLQNLSQELEGFHHFDELYVSGDPKALDFMTQEPEGQQAFLKLMPMALQKFEQLDKGGYTGYMAGVFMSTMDAFRLPLVLERLQDFVGENPKALELLGKISGFYGEMQKLSQSKSEFKPPEARTADPRQAELDDREASITRGEWGRESARSQQVAFDHTFKELLEGRSPTDIQLEAMSELFQIKFEKALKEKSKIEDLTHEQVLERFRMAKDKSGFLRYAGMLNSEVLPLKLKLVVDSVMPAKPGPKAAPAPGARQPQANGAAPSKGFTQVAKPPTLDQVDMRHPFNQGTANWSKGLAVLKDGTKVQFKRA